MVDLWALHIDSLRQTFEQSLMKIFQRVQDIWSRQESVMEGQTNGWTDGRMDRQIDGQTKAISIIPHPLCCGGLAKTKMLSAAVVITQLWADSADNKSSAKRGIIHPWQVIRCSAKTGSCIIQCSGYKL